MLESLVGEPAFAARTGAATIRGRYRRASAARVAGSPDPARPTASPDVVDVELVNRSGVAIDEAALVEVCRRVLSAEGIDDGDLGVSLVEPGEIRALKRKHLGVDEPTDVLSFPIDGRDRLLPGVPRQLGDVVLCPQVVGSAWEAPLVHGLLHLLGYDHGDEMARREKALAP